MICINGVSGKITSIIAPILGKRAHARAAARISAGVGRQAHGLDDRLEG